MPRITVLILLTISIFLAACGGVDEGFSPEMQEMIHKKNQRTFDMFDGHGVYHTETGYFETAEDMPKNRDQILAGDLSNLLQLRDPDPRFFAYFPDVPNENSATSYFEELGSGKHVQAFILVADGFGFVAIEPTEDLEADVIYCLPDELGVMAEASQRCFATSAVQPVPSG